MSKPHAQPPRSTGSQAVTALFGTLLLFPGLCSLFVALGTQLDPKEPMFGTLITVWGITFALAVLGIVLLVRVARNARNAEPSA